MQIALNALYPRRETDGKASVQFPYSSDLKPGKCAFFFFGGGGAGEGGEEVSARCSNKKKMTLSFVKYFTSLSFQAKTEKWCCKDFLLCITNVEIYWFSE